MKGSAYPLQGMTVMQWNEGVCIHTARDDSYAMEWRGLHTHCKGDSYAMEYIPICRRGTSLVSDARWAWSLLLQLLAVAAPAAGPEHACVEKK